MWFKSKRYWLAFKFLNFKITASAALCVGCSYTFFGLSAIRR